LSPLASPTRRSSDLGQRRGRKCRGHVDGLLTSVDALLGLHVRVVIGQVGRLRPELARVEVADVRWVADGLGHCISFYVVGVVSRSEEHTSELQSRFD